MNDPESTAKEVRRCAMALIDYLWRAPIEGIPFHLVSALEGALNAQVSIAHYGARWRVTDEQIDALLLDGEHGYASDYHSEASVVQSEAFRRVVRSIWSQHPPSLK